jgi:hypothetical protein
VSQGSLRRVELPRSRCGHDGQDAELVPPADRGPAAQGNIGDDDRRTYTRLIGHYAPALVLQRARPSVRLWQLFVATQLVDVLWTAFVFGGIEHARIVPGFTESNDLDLWDCSRWPPGQGDKALSLKLIDP